MQDAAVFDQSLLAGCFPKLPRSCFVSLRYGVKLSVSQQQGEAGREATCHSYQGQAPNEKQPICSTPDKEAEGGKQTRE